jgi:hypothetical protein
MKRDTFMSGRFNEALRSPEVEAAKYLINTARSFVNARAHARDLDEAVQMWVNARKRGSDDAQNS